MQVTTLTGEQATATLIGLVSRSVRIAVAVAWAGPNRVVNALLKKRSKLGKVVIGTHMYQTDPSVLRRFSTVNAARYMPPDGRLFHPKVYLFQTTVGMSAIVGSHNMTAGAFEGKNIEVSVLIEGAASEKVFADLGKFINDNWAKAAPIDEDSFLFSYEAQYRANKARLAALQKFSRWARSGTASKSPVIELTWEKFVAGVKADKHHGLDGRLKILGRASELFYHRGSFARMEREERRAIAGTYGPKEEQLDGLNWAWGEQVSRSHLFSGAGEAQRRDQAQYERRGHLRQRCRHHAPGRRHDARAERRVVTQPPIHAA